MNYDALQTVLDELNCCLGVASFMLHSICGTHAGFLSLCLSHYHDHCFNYDFCLRIFILDFLGSMRLQYSLLYDRSHLWRPRQFICFTFDTGAYLLLSIELLEG